ncbi:1-aminocyclopropane-1-carboxylate deaminase/D-cysteine desulfhydrase [Lentiprolixibacter aurantiacus]|uniref:Pyridoxal-phosphate dependent enzyme n=1 Tax=Lentiprolixibacter aurantiacus TaxID=2993939 RepID=A0AAE3SN33_9FLAO|nr:pyridoxal-phosphate dependent enzyme [Lentiprolixibacter aurantiacus]MCX2717992.1 pyridoxal-phosphate dependent enzyme [Lentiprolixibacter aurantiacus]
MDIPNQKIELPILEEHGVTLNIKREDLIHPLVSGNKYRKLKYNLQAAREGGFDTLLTFGGAYSNHIAATAFAGAENGLRTIGVIRGEELEYVWQDNPTLREAHRTGMHFHFMSRKDYRQKTTTSILDKLKERWGKFYVLPEGGTNILAVKGCEEILKPQDAHFDFIASCVGTGGTLAGLINSARPHQEVLGFPVLKDEGLKEDIPTFVKRGQWRLIWDYHFGGYAKVSRELVTFINDFRRKTGVSLDPIYTGKLLYGIIDLIGRGKFKTGTNILAIHSGGLQGIAGMNNVLKKKNLPLIEV